MFTKEEIALAKPVYEALRKLGWEWKPEWLDPLLFTYGKYSEVYWFKCPDLSERFKGWIYTLTKDIEETALHIPQKDCIPLLHWEKIEGILEEFGYEVEHSHHNRETCQRLEKYVVEIWKPGDTLLTSYICGYGKTRQEAVMKAVIELAKEVA